MATLEYRFTRSAPVLRDLARTRPPSPPPSLLTGASEYIEKVKPFEFIDDGLGLLASLQRAQDNHLRREFEQQREFIASKFEGEQYENGIRDSAVEQRFTKIKEQLENFKHTVGRRFEEVGQRFDLAETELNSFRQEVGQRFDEMNARMFNSLSYRGHHQIHPVAVFKKGRLLRPDEDYFPRNITKFWNLHSRKKAYNRFRLLQFYSIEEYKWWNREDETSESDPSDSSPESLTLEDAARSYPSRCLEALAARLGLDYDKICAEMMRLQENRQQTSTQLLKRRQADVISSKDGEVSKRAHRSVAPSTTSDLQSNPSESPLQVQNSPGATDVVYETDLVGTEQRSQGSTEVMSFGETQSRS